MKIEFSRTFEKQYAKLRSQEKNKVDHVISSFQDNPYDPILKNHSLKGEMKGRRAIAAGGDLRLIFREYEKYTLVLFLEVGSHNQVY